MKKLLLVAFISALSLTKTQAQCVSSCGVYNVSSINYSLFPAGPAISQSSFVPTADDGTLTVPIGFSFNFYCNNYTSINICTNGFMQFDYGTPIDFGTPVYSHPAQNFPNSTAPNGLVALNMNDFDLTAGGSISYNTVGTAPNRIFILTYDAVPIWYDPLSGIPSSPVYNTGQIVLFETTNIIEIHSGAIGQSPYAGTQGIENTTGTVGLNAPGRGATMWSSALSTAYRFAPYTPTPPTAITGVTTICAGLQTSYSAPNMPGALSYTWNAPGQWGGTSNSTIFTATTGLSGNVQVRATYTCGTSAPTSLFVTSIAAPNVALTLAPNVICSGQSVTVTPNGADNYTLEPGGLISNGPIIFTPSFPATYTLYGSDANNCVSFNNPTANSVVYQTPIVTVNSGTICAGQSFTMVPDGATSYTFSNFSSVVTPTAGVYSYTVTGTNTDNCRSEPAIAELTVNAIPSISVTASRPMVCINQAATITASGADTYSWTNGPATAINIVTLTTTSAFTVTGTSAEGCSKRSTITIGVDACTGIAENGKSRNKITVYPNPSNGAFTLETPATISVIIYDLQGRVVRQQQLEEGTHQVDLSELNAGNYFLRSTDPSGSQSMILVKE